MYPRKVKVGVIGCGNISRIYFERMTRSFEVLDLAACADLDMSRAAARAEEYPGVAPVTVDDILADAGIEIIVNLTPPAAHGEVAIAAVEAGKSVYNEKPLAVTRGEGEKILETAAGKGVLVGCAPDTFLGAGLQTCRKLIDDGWIGEPVAAAAFMTCHGHESWHPNPAFYYAAGGGPMLDMGPYYLTALVHLIGPVKRVTGSARITFPERIVTAGPLRGTRIPVETPTHIAGVIDFRNGAIGTIVTSFDVWAARLPRIEIYGTAGSLSVPDPNTFGGPVRVKMAGAEEWSEIPLTHGHAENFRGIGVADMACALLAEGRAHRASGALAFHVLDVMLSFRESSETGKHVEVKSTCRKPDPLPPGLREGVLDP